ncbi:MAG: LysR family transcriptional regulator [Rhodoferax sp.]|jgi:DNA-binding transcriptional LysR family regulator
MKNSPDRIELMQTFVRIVEAGSLSAAALQIGATQPTVSRRLQALERSLGLRLLQRSTHAMKLTEEGERCFARAKQLLGSWDAFEADLRGRTDAPEGTLRVVVPHAIGQQELVVQLAEYLQRHPKVSVEWLLHDRTPEFITGGIDCAIHVGPVEDSSLVALKIAEIPRIVVASPALLAPIPLPQQPGDLAPLPWLALHSFYRNEVTLIHARGEQRSLSLQPRMSTDSLFALRNAALLGLGVGVVSAWAVKDDVAHGTLVHLLPDWHAAPLPIYVLYPYANYYPAKLRRFVEIIRAALPQDIVPQPSVIRP